MLEGNIKRVKSERQHQTQFLAYKSLQHQSKKFFLDVKANGRGRFILAVELHENGNRSRVNFSFSTAVEIRGHLIAFEEFYECLEPHKSDDIQDDGKLKEAVIYDAGKRYLLVLREDNHERFLSVVQLERGGSRTCIFIPALRMKEWRINLSNLIDEYHTESEDK